MHKHTNTDGPLEFSKYCCIKKVMAQRATCKKSRSVVYLCLLVLSISASCSRSSLFLTFCARRALNRSCSSLLLYRVLCVRLSSFTCCSSFTISPRSVSRSVASSRDKPYSKEGIYSLSHCFQQFRPGISNNIKINKKLALSLSLICS